MGHPIHFIWMWALSQGGASFTQFPLDRLHLCQLIPFSSTEVLLPHEEGEERLETYPHFPEILWESSEEEHSLSNLIALLVPTSAPPPCLEEGTQMEGIRLSSSQYTNRGRVRLSPSPQASAGCQSSQSSTGILAHPGNTGVGKKV